MVMGLGVACTLSRGPHYLIYLPFLHPTPSPPLPSHKHSLVQRLATQGLEGLKGDVGACPKGQKQENRRDGQLGHG